MTSESDAWAQYRWNSVKYRIHHGAITADVAVGYVGGVQDTLPSTTAQVMELIPAVYQGVTYTQPSAWVKIPKADLAGPLPWYKSVPGAATNVEELPGYLCFAGTGTDTIVIEMMGVIEFKTAVAPANTPMAMKLRQELRQELVRTHAQAEKAKMLRALSGGQT